MSGWWELRRSHDSGAGGCVSQAISKRNKDANAQVAERLAEIGDLGAAIGYLETASGLFLQEVNGGRAGNHVDCTPTGVIRSLIPDLRQHCARVRPAGPGYR